MTTQNIKNISMERTDLLRLQRTAEYYDSIGQYKKADIIDALIREAALTDAEKGGYGLGAGILGVLGGSAIVGANLPKENKKPISPPAAISAPAPVYNTPEVKPVQRNIRTPEVVQSPVELEKPVVEELDNLSFEEPRQERFEANIIPKPKPKPLSIPIQKPTEKPVVKSIEKPAAKPVARPVVKKEEAPAVKEPRKFIEENAEPKPQLSNKQRMERGDFGATMDLMLNLEGKKTDDPRDRGGRTNFGVTQGTYNRWRDSKNLPRQDVFKITKDEAMQLYKKNFWGIIGGDKLPQKTAMALMSFALTDGPEDSVRLVQRMLKIPATGYMGPATLDKINKLVKKYGDEGFANKVLNRQIIRYKNDEQAHIYGRGWVNRANKVRTRISKL
jgi:hypothetical protein